MLSFLSKTPSEMQQQIKDIMKQKRKALRLTQSELGHKSGVSLGSVKRFEQ